MISRSLKKITFALAAGVALSAPAIAAKAEALEFPRVSVWTSYPTGTAYYIHASVMGQIMKDQLGSTIRIVPGRNDLARFTPLKNGMVSYAIGGIATYFAQEGLYSFNQEDWGPQPVRLVLTHAGDVGMALGVATDVGVDSIADLKGKRVAYFQGGDAINLATEAYLAYGGLTWDDVRKIPVGGPRESIDALLNGLADALAASTGNPINEQLFNSPRGLKFLEMPNKTEEDKAAWARVRAVAPFMQPMTAVSGIGITDEKPVYAGNYPVPIISTLSRGGERVDEVYTLLRTLDENFAEFNRKAPESDGWALSRQPLSWLMPYHDGAIKYFKEKGVWTDEHQQHNDLLIKRQEVLQKAWSEFMAARGSQAFDAEEWREARVAALESAGFEPGLK